MGRFKDLTNQKINRLTVIKKQGINKYGGVDWLCQCDCGKYTIVSSNMLNSGQIKSCGCLRKEKHFKTHGLSKHKLYRVYYGILGRCYDKKNKKYYLYGEKGITMCAAWKDDFMAFYNWAINNGYKKGLTIDRIDSNKNYEPTNCRWVTTKEQNRNLSTNHKYTYNNKTKCLGEWAEIYNISINTLRSRIRSGWSILKALTTPVKHKNILKN